jgi:hypothetical protein
MATRPTVSLVSMKPSPRFLGWLGMMVVLVGLLFWLLPGDQRDATIAVAVTEVMPAGENLWLAPGGVLDEGSPHETRREVVRLNHLRTQRLPVRVEEHTGDRLVLRSSELGAGDLLIIKPGGLRPGQAVVPTAGVTPERLIRLTLDAGIAAVMAEDLAESVRFLSRDYRDSLELTNPVLAKILERTYQEFDSPQIELIEPPEIEVTGDQALVQVKLGVSAVYRGRRNYLLGDEYRPNAVRLTLGRLPGGWKVAGIEGLRPLGLDEGFLRLLAAQVGLGLSRAEEEQRQRACMPCRQRMAERFGPTG